jgi:hypothetical protein
MAKERAMKLKFAVIVLIAAAAIIGCGGSTETVPESTPATPSTVAENQSGIVVENAFYYTHVNGAKKESERVAYVLFEYEQLESVKYQVAYIACTCRGADVNYYSVAYVELSKADGSIQFLSYDEDSTGHYTAGMYGDSTETWEGVPAKELYAQFREERLIGASQAEVLAMESMHGEVDAYTGATVTPNNAVRMLQKLFGYHNERY